MKVRECHNELEDEGRESTAQVVIRKSADFLRTITAPSDGESHYLTCVLIVIASRLKTTSGGSRRCTATATRRKDALQLAVCSLRQPVRLEGSEQSHTRHAAPQGMCVNLINGLKLLPNQQKDGDSPVRMIVPGLLEKESAPNNRRPQVACCSRQLCGSRDRGSGERNEVQESGKAKVHDRFLGSYYSGRRG